MGVLLIEPDELDESRFSICDSCLEKESELPPPTQVEDDMFAPANPSSTRSRSIADRFRCCRSQLGGEEGRESSNPDEPREGTAYSMDVEMGDTRDVVASCLVW